MITLVQNIQLRFYKNSEDLRMFREEVEIGVMWRVQLQLCSPPIRSDHYAACTNQKRSRITVLPAPIRSDHGSLFCLHQSHTIMKITDHCEKSP